MVAKQQAGVEAIRRLGGIVAFDNMKPTRSAWLEFLSGDDAFGNARARNQLFDPFATKVTDTELAHLQGRTQLRTLWLSDSQVTDAGLVHVREFTQLWNLSLYRSQVTDAGIDLSPGNDATTRVGTRQHARQRRGTRPSSWNVTTSNAATPQHAGFRCGTDPSPATDTASIAIALRHAS